MSLLREYKDRRASAEGWPYYHDVGGVERVHHAKVVDSPEPEETTEPFDTPYSQRNPLFLKRSER